MSVSILSIKQFGDAVKCVENGRGNTNYCMHHSGSAIGWLSTTSVNYDFHSRRGLRRLHRGHHGRRAGDRHARRERDLQPGLSARDRTSCA